MEFDINYLYIIINWKKVHIRSLEYRKKFPIYSACKLAFSARTKIHFLCNSRKKNYNTN